MLGAAAMEQLKVQGGMCKILLAAHISFLFAVAGGTSSCATYSRQGVALCEWRAALMHGEARAPAINRVLASNFAQGLVQLCLKLPGPMKNPR
jgi:hypothetical protein